MPFYLIGLKNSRTWDRDDYTSWLPADQAPADVYREFRVEEGKLSIWHIEDDRSNLNQVITALAVGRMEYSPFEYGLFDHNLVLETGVKTEETPGTTPMPRVNPWHRDLVELTARNFSVFVEALFFSMEVDRKLSSSIQEMIINAARAEEVELPRVHKKMRSLIQSALT